MKETIIYPPAPTENSPCRIQMAGVSYCDGSYFIRRTPESNFWVFEYIESGRGFLEVEKVRCEPAAGDLYIVPGGTTHYYGSSSEAPWVKYWVNVSGELVATLIRLFHLEGVILVPGFSHPELFADLHRRLRKYPADSHRRIGPEFLTSLITTAACDLAAAEPSPISPEAAQLRQRLDDAIFEPTLSLDEMAALLSRSKVQTIRIFRRNFGETPVQYQLRRKVEAAAELLRDTSKPIKEIAALLCFSDEYYFATLFKRKFGISPGRCRARSRGNRE